MLYISDTCTDAYFNLAEEEYLFTSFKEPIFRLWQNDNAIIVGKYQNTLSQINYNYVKENNIKVVRRLTGGGAVYHDIGNLNYTFIEPQLAGESASDMFARFTRPIIEALNSLGVEAYLEGRNDLLIDGKKFSGNAVAIGGGRVLQHGTLLFCSNMSVLDKALKAQPEKFKDKGVKSNISRVTNISNYLSGNQSVGWFKEYLGEWICNNMSGVEKYNLTDADMREIEQLAKTKYSTDRWNYSSSPQYAFSNRGRFAGGTLEVYIDVQEGFIKDVKIFGDYFFTRPTEEFAAQLVGISHRYEDVAKKIDSLDVGAYFNNITRNELIDLMF